VLPNEKHEFSKGWQAAQKSGPAGCTTGRASGLHIKAGCTVSWAAEKSGRRAALFRSPPARPSVFCAASQPVHVFRLETRPAGPPINAILRL